MGTSGLLTRQNAQEVSHTLGPTSTQEYVLRKFDSQRGFPDKLATTADFVTLQNTQQLSRIGSIGRLANLCVSL